MPDTDAVHLLSLLDEERRLLVAAVNQIPAEERNRQPAPGAWSVAEVLEHQAQVERGGARLHEVRGQEEPNAQAPERVRPSGTRSADAALRALEASRARLRAAVSGAQAASLDGCTHAHAVLGMLTLRDWARFVAHHEARHATQISEIARALA